MGELRKDYILDRYVIISTIRKERPHEFKSEDKAKSGICVFCPGNEHLTPPETEVHVENGEWQIRVIPNKFPAVTEEGQKWIKTDNDFFTFSSSFGKHEVIIETRDHEKQLADLDLDQIKNLLKIYIKRINKLSKVKGVKYVLVFKNKGKEAATSIAHSHSQIIAYNKIPRNINQKIKAMRKFENCPYCQIIDIEKNSHRAVYENNSFVSFTPYASRFPYELWMFPKRHVKSIVKLNEGEINDMAEMMKRILMKLKRLNAPYNFYLQNSPNDKDFHFHVEIIPRLSIWGGFEYGSGTIINVVSPEDAAAYYKNEE